MEFIKTLSPSANLLDTTFVIPFFKDSNDRIENLKCIIHYLTENFNTKIFIIEQAHRPTFSIAYLSGVNYQLIKTDAEPLSDFIFHRTRIINEGIKRVSTPYLAVYDTDVVFVPEQIVKAVELLRSGTQVCYPYDGRLIDIARSYRKDGYIIESISFATESKGGAVFLNTEDYFKAGLENENIFGWGHEDSERWHRLYTLGYSISHVDGKCWHISHERGINSSNQNPYDAKNKEEYEKVKAMNKGQLQQYISQWQWVNQ